MDDQDVYPVAVHAAVAKWRSQNCHMDDVSGVYRLGAAFDRTDISPVQSSAVLHKQRWRMH